MIKRKIMIRTLPVLIFGTLLLLAGSFNVFAADVVELNGISCLGGERMAFLVLYQPALPRPLGFMLAEGESRFGWKLLAVDAASHRVQVEKCGVKKYLRLDSAPDLTVSASSELAAATEVPISVPPFLADGKSLVGYLDSAEVTCIQAGNPIWTGAVAGAGKNSGSSQNSSGSQTSAASVNSSGQNSVAVGGSGNPNNPAANPAAPASAPNYAGEVWYQESISIEQSRAQTAEDVLAGKLTPFPRTPLTPASTPGQLVSEEVYFAGNIPGFKVTGFLNQ